MASWRLDVFDFLCIFCGAFGSHVKRSGPLRPGEGIVLIGPRGSGKSALGKTLARSLGWPFYSTDEMISHRTGLRTDHQISKFGWKVFRQYEAEAIRSACLPGSKVVDTGGGAGIRDENRSWIRKHRVIFLNVDIEIAVNRLESDKDVNRPPLKPGRDPKNDWEAMMQERFWVYRNMADVQIESSQSAPLALARTVLDLIVPRAGF